MVPGIDTRQGTMQIQVSALFMSTICRQAWQSEVLINWAPFQNDAGAGLTQCRRRAWRNAESDSITMSTPSVAHANTKKPAQIVSNEYQLLRGFSETLYIGKIYVSSLKAMHHVACISYSLGLLQSKTGLHMHSSCSSNTA